MKSNLVENTTEWTTLHSQLLPLRLSQSVSQFTFHCRENVRSSILVFCFAVFSDEDNLFNRYSRHLHKRFTGEVRSTATPRMQMNYVDLWMQTKAKHTHTHTMPWVNANDCDWATIFEMKLQSDSNFFQPTYFAYFVVTFHLTW